MHAPSFASEITDYILSGHAYLHCPTTEKTRFVNALRRIADTLPDGGRRVVTWSHATGWLDWKSRPITAASMASVPSGEVPDDDAADGVASDDAQTMTMITPATSLPATSGPESGPPDPQVVPQQMLDMPDDTIFVLKDFGYYVRHKTYSYADVVVAWLCEVRDTLAATGRTVIFLGPDFDVPASLANDVTTVTFPLPDDEDIESSVEFVLDDRDIDKTALSSIISACRGMTEQQVEDRVALALRRFKSLNSDAARLILREKAEVIRRSGLLTYQEPPDGGLALIGGNDAVKAHIVRDKACFGENAREFGIDPPRGILLTGISGCGKTAISLAAAAELGVPLIQFDVGAMMSKWVGESESNTRNALAQVEAMSPCVLQIDEVEKGFGAVGDNGDSGAGLRTFGTLLKWMSERTCPVYIIMTANDVSRLPPEFTRKGRIDEIFGVYLPRRDERRDIFAIHLRRRQRDPEQFDLAALAKATEAYSGADIEQVVVTGLKLAFHAERELMTDHLLAAVPEVRPLSQTDPERVAAMTAWLDKHTRPASTGHGDSLSTARRCRKVAV